MPIVAGNDANAAFKALAAATAFKNVPEAATQALVRSAHRINLKSGQRLFEYGDAGGSMFVVLSGAIEVSVSTAEGRKISLNMLEPGQCFGEVSMIDGLARTADATAMADCQLLSIPREAFLTAARQYPELGLAMAEALCERVRWISDSVEDYALLPLDRRLAKRILILFDRFGGGGNSIDISQSDLADFAGATRESTNKILTQWRSRGWITMGRKSIQLTNRKALDRLATSGPGSAVAKAG